MNGLPPVASAPGTVGWTDERIEDRNLKQCRERSDRRRKHFSSPENSHPSIRLLHLYDLPDHAFCATRMASRRCPRPFHSLPRRGDGSGCPVHSKSVQHIIRVTLSYGEDQAERHSGRRDGSALGGEKGRTRSAHQREPIGARLLGFVSRRIQPEAPGQNEATKGVRDRSCRRRQALVESRRSL